MKNIIKLTEQINPFEGTATELSYLLKTKLNVEVLPSVLSKKLKKNIQFLKDHNIEFQSLRSRLQRTIQLNKIKENSDVSDGCDANNGP